MRLQPKIVWGSRRQLWCVANAKGFSVGAGDSRGWGGCVFLCSAEI